MWTFLAVIWPDRILVGSCDHKYLRNHPPTHCAVSWLASLMFFTRIINFMIPMWDQSIVLTQDSNKTGGLYSTFIKKIITTWFGAGLFTPTGIGFAPFRILDMYSQSSARDLKRVHPITQPNLGYGRASGEPRYWEQRLDCWHWLMRTICRAHFMMFKLEQKDLRRRESPCLLPNRGWANDAQNKVFADLVQSGAEPPLGYTKYISVTCSSLNICQASHGNSICMT